MAPNVDWEKILAANPAEIQDVEDDSVIEDWCSRVAEVWLATLNELADM